ncbi:MAG TPA: class I SAM-dependent methyltransferase [Candidatus Didemnitutus sp.]|nr:class I SAM-dependent methyltransferase [Candidatus Didemnitutus sp.]
MTTDVHPSPVSLSGPTPAKPTTFRWLLSHLRLPLLRARQPHWEAGALAETQKQAPDEPRLQACARLLRYHTRHPDVLEIGCGEARLMRHLMPGDYATWLGIDVSPTAIERAQRFGNSRVRYIAANVAALDLASSYDAIIFSQSIYYLPDPTALLRRYARYLKPCGVFIISLFENGTQAPVWREIHTAAYSIGSCVTQESGGIWTCEALRMRRTISQVPVDTASL